MPNISQHNLPAQECVDITMALFNHTANIIHIQQLKGPRQNVNVADDFVCCDTK